MLKQAGYFAERLKKETGSKPETQIDRAFHLAFGRTTSLEEKKAAQKTIHDKGLFTLCHVLLNANEFVYID